VFNQSTPSTGKAQRSASRKIAKIAAMAAIGSLGTALAIAAPTSASAATTPASLASGQFLAGSIGGIDLARLAAIQAASVQNSGSQSMQVSRDPLGVSALGATLIHLPAGLQLNLGKVIDLGAAQQYAQASSNGTSMAASGAVSNNGGIGVDGADAGAGGSATVDLDALLGSKFASVLSDLKLTTSAVASQAAGDLKNASGKYTLAGLNLTLTSPAIAGLTGRVTDALGPLDGQLAALDGPNGQLAGAVNNVVTGINPILNLTGSNAAVSANVSVDLATAVQPLLTGVYGDGSVSFNLQTGAVTVDLAKLLGGNINSEPVGTQVLSAKVVNEILTGITGTVNTLVDQIVAKVKDALDNANVNVDATVNLLTAQAPLLGQTCVAGGMGAGTSGTGGTTGTGGLLGGLLGGTSGTGTDTLGGTVSGLLCTNTSKILPSLPTSLAAHIHGTVDQLVSGTAPAANATLTLLGTPVNVNLSGAQTGIGSLLTNNLLGGTAGESGLASALNTDVVAPAVTGLLGSGTSVEDALTHVLSVSLNNQGVATTPTGSTFTETALKVQALPDGTNSAATVDLANSSVGPDATTIVPGDPGTPSNPTDPGSPTTPGDPGTPAIPVTPTAFGNLAFTGVGIAGLVSTILALLAAGAYLVREGYRRNSRRLIP
jgi:hypothetical protein